MAEFAERISVQLTEQDFQRLTELAEAMDRSVSYVARLAIAEYLDAHEGSAPGQS